MNRLDECIEELEFLKTELNVHWEEHKRLRQLRSETTIELDASTKNIAQFQEAIYILEKEKALFDSGGSKAKFALLEDSLLI